jgi:hypothetical protein
MNLSPANIAMIIAVIAVVAAGIMGYMLFSKPSGVSVLEYKLDSTLEGDTAKIHVNFPITQTQCPSGGGTFSQQGNGNWVCANNTCPDGWEYIQGTPTGWTNGCLPPLQSIVNIEGSGEGVPDDSPLPTQSQVGQQKAKDGGIGTEGALAIAGVTVVGIGGVYFLGRKKGWWGAKSPKGGGGS